MEQLFALSFSQIERWIHRPTVLFSFRKKKNNNKQVLVMRLTNLGTLRRSRNVTVCQDVPCVRTALLRRSVLFTGYSINNPQ